ncbi:MAG: tetratricopeptide repeat protein [Bacteroidia bacterium]
MENDLVLISDYLAGDLTDADKSIVETRIQTDADFAALFREQQVRVNIFRASVRAEEKARMKEVFRTDTRVRMFSHPMWIASAVAAAIALLILVWVSPWKKEVTAEQLAMNYLDSYPLSVPRGAGADSVLKDSAYRYYQAGEYALATPLFQEMYADSAEPQTGLLLGECLSQTGRYKEATEIFTILAKDSPFRDAAQWRLALNQLLGGETAAARQTLTEISGSSHYRSAQADSLLNLLRE